MRLWQYTSFFNLESVSSIANVMDTQVFQSRECFKHALVMNTQALQSRVFSACVYGEYTSLPVRNVSRHRQCGWKAGISQSCRPVSTSSRSASRCRIKIDTIGTREVPSSRKCVTSLTSCAASSGVSLCPHESIRTRRKWHFEGLSTQRQAAAQPERREAVPGRKHALVMNTNFSIWKILSWRL